MEHFTILVCLEYSLKLGNLHHFGLLRILPKAASLLNIMVCVSKLVLYLTKIQVPPKADPPWNPSPLWFVKNTPQICSLLNLIVCLSLNLYIISHKNPSSDPKCNEHYLRSLTTLVCLYVNMYGVHF